MSDVYGTIHLERMGAVAILTLSRPERMNAIDKQMLGELQDALDDVERDLRQQGDAVAVGHHLKYGGKAGGAETEGFVAPFAARAARRRSPATCGFQA